MRFRQAMSVLAQAMIEAEKLHPGVSSGLCAVIGEFTCSLVSYEAALKRRAEGEFAYSNTYYWRKAVVALCKVAGVQEWHMQRLEAHIQATLQGTRCAYLTGILLAGSEFTQQQALAARTQWLRTLGREHPAVPAKKD